MVWIDLSVVKPFCFASHFGNPVSAKAVVSHYFCLTLNGSCMHEFDLTSSCVGKYCKEVFDSGEFCFQPELSAKGPIWKVVGKVKQKMPLSKAVPYFEDVEGWAVPVTPTILRARPSTDPP